MRHYTTPLTAIQVRQEHLDRGRITCHFPQAAPCPFSILGRTLNIDESEINTIIIMVTDVRWLGISSIIVEHVLLYY